MNKLETRIFHTIGFVLTKAFPQPKKITISSKFEDATPPQDMVQHFKLLPGYRLGMYPGYYDFENDSLTHANSFRYGGYGKHGYLVD